MVLRSWRVQNTNSPPQPPTHLGIKRAEAKCAPITVHSEGLRQPDGQASRVPRVGRVARAQYDQVHNECLQREHVVRFHQPRAREGTVRALPELGKQGGLLRSEEELAVVWGEAVDGAEVYHE